MEKITMAHGSGGSEMHKLIESVFLKEFSNPMLDERMDSAIFNTGAGKMAFTTDSYVVKPIFFPGGDIGRLAVCGTVNDLAVCGAKPLYISLGLVIKEGLDREVLEKIVKSIKTTAREAGVSVVTGDTKVVEKGSCDNIFINTSGVGKIYYESLSLRLVKPGDAVIVSGPVGDHAVSVLSEREGIRFNTRVKSDAQPLNDLIGKVLSLSKCVKFMRDPTRGGLATTLNEFTNSRKFGIEIDEKRVPVRPGVSEACEILGLDPLYLSCEGRVVMIVDNSGAGDIIKAMRAHPKGKGACVIGKISSEHKGKVFINTVSGGRRMAPMLAGEQLPRIC